MDNWEDSLEVLKSHSFNGVKPYLFYAMDKEPFGFGVFYTFPTQNELLQVIHQSIFAFNGEQDDVDLENFTLEINEIFDEQKDSAELSEKFIRRLNSILVNTKIEFIGTFDELLKGASSFAKEYRSRFRAWCLPDISDHNYKPHQTNSSPIHESEREMFEHFVMKPEWE